MDAFADPFLLTLACATALRGLGAGVIAGVVLITLSPRRRVGIGRFAHCARIQFRTPGVTAYAAITVLGSVLTVAAFVVVVVAKPLALQFWLAVSILATVFGFVGTAGAFPAMRRLRQTPDDDEMVLGRLLDSFARWGWVSAVSHVVAFMALVLALGMAR